MSGTGRKINGRSGSGRASVRTGRAVSCDPDRVAQPPLEPRPQSPHYGPVDDRHDSLPVDQRDPIRCRKSVPPVRVRASGERPYPSCRLLLELARRKHGDPVDDHATAVRARRVLRGTIEHPLVHEWGTTRPRGADVRLYRVTEVGCPRSEQIERVIQIQMRTLGGTLHCAGKPPTFAVREDGGIQGGHAGEQGSDLGPSSWEGVGAIERDFAGLMAFRNAEDL